MGCDEIRCGGVGSGVVWWDGEMRDGVGWDGMGWGGVGMGWGGVGWGGVGMGSVDFFYDSLVPPNPDRPARSKHPELEGARAPTLRLRLDHLRGSAPAMYT